MARYLSPQANDRATAKAMRLMAEANALSEIVAGRWDRLAIEYEAVGDVHGGRLFSLVAYSGECREVLSSWESDVSFFSPKKEDTRVKVVCCLLASGLGRDGLARAASGEPPAELDISYRGERGLFPGLLKQAAGLALEQQENARED